MPLVFERQPGVGKGNWSMCHFLSTWSSLIPFSLSLSAARPSKEEKARLADEKNAANSVKAEAVAVAGDEDAVGEEEDAEGEEE